MPRNKYPEETVKKILETSLKLFLEKGYEETTVLDIVSNLGGLTRGAFYHHFKSKEEVLDAIFANMDGENHPFEKASRAKVSNGLERVKFALKDALKSNVESELQAAMTHLAMSLMSNPRFLVEKLKGDIESAALLAPMIKEGMSDGSIKPGNPKIMAELLMVLINFWMMPAIFPCEPAETFEKAELVAQIFENLGFPILDDEMGEIYADVFNQVLSKQ